MSVYAGPGVVVVVVVVVAGEAAAWAGTITDLTTGLTQLVAALERLADREMCSVSHVARSAVLKELRQHGLMTESAPAAA